MLKIRVSLLSLALMFAVPVAPQALAKTAAATASAQPEIASGSAMIVDLQTNGLSIPATRIWYVPSRLSLS